MADAHRYLSKVAWSVKTQSAFGTPLAKTDLTKLMLLTDPMIIKRNVEHWTDRGMVGTGTDFESQRGVLKRWISMELPVQPVPVDFAAMLVALFFSAEAYTSPGTNTYQHVAKFLPFATLAEAKVTSLAIHEDGDDQCVQDVCVSALTIRGQADGRLEMGASLLGSKLATPLAAYTWPSVVTPRWLYNFAGVYTRATTDKKSELRSFELSLDAGINMDIAWRKVAAEADRSYPSVWPHSPERRMSLKTTHVCAATDLSTFIAAHDAGTEVATVISCLGGAISGSDPADSDEMTINVPKGVYTDMDYGFQNGRLQVDLTIDGHYDTSGSLNSPISITTVEGSAGELLVAAT